MGAGEIIFNSIDQDGTGFGYDLELCELATKLFPDSPIIISGGAGKPEHFIEVLNQYEMISAVSTGNLFNFLGEGLSDSRKKLINEKIELPIF